MFHGEKPNWLWEFLVSGFVLSPVVESFVIFYQGLVMRPSER